MEKLDFPDGQLKALGPNHYKIPAVSDTPRQFNVHFLKKATHKPVIYGSKVNYPVFFPDYPVITDLSGLD